MQFDSQVDSMEALERARILYSEAYQRLVTNRVSFPNESEKRALELFRHSRKSESERVQLWISDPLLFESLGFDLSSLNYPLLAIQAFEYAQARGGGLSADCLVAFGRAHHRLKHSEKAQALLEQALQLGYYAAVTRYWLAVVSFPWSQHFQREVHGALSFQRLYRGHCGRRLATERRVCSTTSPRSLTFLYVSRIGEQISRGDACGVRPVFTPTARPPSPAWPFD